MYWNFLNLEHWFMHEIKRYNSFLFNPRNFPKFLQENSRLENELLENTEKLAEYESLTNKLQRNLENVLAEKVNLFKCDFLKGNPEM